MVKLSEAEKKTLCNWMDTDTGAKLLESIKETGQGYINEAMLGIAQGQQYTHDRVVAAQAIDTIYRWLKAYRKEEPRQEE